MWTFTKYALLYVALVAAVLLAFNVTGHAQMFGEDPADSSRFGQRRMPMFDRGRYPAILDQDMNQRYVLPMAPNTYVITPPLEANNLTGLTPKQPVVPMPEQRPWLDRLWDGKMGRGK